MRYSPALGLQAVTAPRLLVLRLLLLLATGWAGGGVARASHIAGADLTYTCLGPAQGGYLYELELTMYRDCINANPEAFFDNPIYMFVFDAGRGQTLSVLEVRNPEIIPFDPAPVAACVGGGSAGLCVERGIYRVRIVLPDRLGGYYVGWARCCRNQIITNLFDPGAVGVTWSAFIPSLSNGQCNSMPVFRGRPPIYLCLNETLTFDHSAVDADGDSLVYRLTPPYDGLNFQGLGPGNQGFGGPPPNVTPNNPMGPPPYALAPYNGAGFDALHPFGNSNGSGARIDPQTGLLQFTPTQVGLYVVAISVFEYRNGVLLSENKRDIQFSVLPCLNFAGSPEIERLFNGQPLTADTIFVDARSSFCYQTRITDPNTGVTLTASTQSAILTRNGSATYTGTNPINGQICWAPACEWVGQTQRVIVTGTSNSVCPDFSTVADTVYLVVQAPPAGPPIITPNYLGNPVAGDTLVGIVVGNTVVFRYTVRRAPGTNGVVTQNVRFVGMGVQQPSQWRIIQSNDSLIEVEVRWTGNCTALNGNPFMVIRANTSGVCPPNDAAADTVYFRVVLPPNPPPVLSQNFAALTLIGDTLQLQMDSTGCWTFALADSAGGGPLAVSALLERLRGGTYAGPGATITLTNQAPGRLEGRLCYPATCPLADETLRLILTGTEPTVCGAPQQVRDTAYIRILGRTNPPPALASDITGLVTVADTIQTLADSSFCYPFTLQDVRPAGVYTATARALLPAGSAIAPTPTVSLVRINDTTYTGAVCWTAACAGLPGPVRLVLTVKDSVFCAAKPVVRDTVYVRIGQPVNPPPILLPDYSALRFDADTAIILADSALCYPFVLDDDLPASHLGVGWQVESLAGVPLASPALSVSLDINLPDTLLRVTVCWRPSCAQFGTTFRFILIASDSNTCTLDYVLRDTLFVRVEQPQNRPAVLSHTFTPPLFGQDADTILVVADSVQCFTLTVRDTFPGSRIGLSNIGLERTNGQTYAATFPVPITQNVLGDSLAVYTFCWQAPCDYFGETLRIVAEATDSSTCTLDFLLRDTLYARIVPRPVAPLSLRWQPDADLEVRGDAVRVLVKRPQCVAITLADSLNGGDVTLSVRSLLQDPNFTANLATLTGDTAAAISLAVRYCWTPTCELLGQTFPVELTGVSNLRCLPQAPTIRDTFYLQLVEPPNSPPTISRDIPAPADVRPGQQLCYTLTVIDPDAFTILSAAGQGAGFSPTFFEGSNAVVDTVYGVNPLIVRICIRPNCYAQNQRFPLVVCATDSSICTSTPVVCDTLPLVLDDCGLLVPNVFTPNGDGINDDFAPYGLEGIVRYELSMFDRWGVEVYPATAQGRWPGTLPNGSPATEGVYFYRLVYWFDSGTGPLWQGDKYGSATLLR